MSAAESFGLVIIVCGILTIGFFMGVTFGSCNQMMDSDRQWQADAVKRGLGQYIVIDSLTGATEFQWRKPDGK